ncbi:DNA-processing protein DprA [Marmoricola sp. URHB0036]|uniref:DNA-processing protein DprA n=1 Tax=Marmoricola sp. URHB0036 TaxID=1298863 RepID=UPI00055C57AA|nr:DNA-processing protein DprA [Marmoricola sp. URHB0036]
MSPGPPVSESERLARAALSRISEPGYPRMTDAVQELGAARVLESLQTQAVHRELGADLAERLASADPQRDLEQAAARGIRFVVPGDDEWPVTLDDLAHAPHLHERGGVPIGLWCRGPLRLAEAAERAVSVVGSRSATTYGGSVAGEIAGTLARESWTVVSGAAFGIDQAAHRGALAGRGPTVAVLACGADRAYPSAHRSLIDYVADVGLVVSEAAPGCAPTRIRFLARNRLIAALARGTVVVEAAVRSGALNTASWAGGLGRMVMGVPGPVTSAPSAGVHQLIRARDAVLVTSGEEVLEAVGPMGSYALSEPREPEHPRDRLEPRQRQVLDAVPLVQAVDSRKIAETAGIAHSPTKEALLVLLRAGLVEHSLGRWRVAADPALDEQGEGWAP